MSVGKFLAFLQEKSAASATEVRTRQIRKLRSPKIGEILIEHTYVDRPASLGTWIDNCAALALEFRISVLDIHERLFDQLPEIFGR